MTKSLTKLAAVSNQSERFRSKLVDAAKVDGDSIKRLGGTKFYDAALHVHPVDVSILSLI